MSAPPAVPMTLGAILAAAALRLDAAGVPEARRDARLLLAHALGRDPSALAIADRETLGASALAAVEAALARRCAREPVARIRGFREFWSLAFALSPETLDPRPDSEALIEAALGEVDDRGAPLAALDLGTGSGCLLLALLSELPAARGLGLDVSAGAVATARANAAALGLAGRAAFAVGDWLDGRADWPAGVHRFDCILSNPPYIESGVIAGLAPEVARYEPRRALDGGVDGLDAYRSLAPLIRELLAPNGFCVIEVGAGQAEAVAAILGKSSLTTTRRMRDLAGHERCLVVRL